MPNVDSRPEPARPLAPRRTQSGHVPQGCRVVHVIVRDQVFNHAKAQAYLSGMKFPEFVAQILLSAGPIKPAGTS